MVLVAVVALCTMENDLLHAGYLALALLFFRRRVDLRSRWAGGGVGFGFAMPCVAAAVPCEPLQQGWNEGNATG